MTKIEKRRLAKNMTRQQLADAIGESYEIILHYEKEMRVPKTVTLKKMSKVLGCRMNDLV